MILQQFPATKQPRNSIDGEYPGLTIQEGTRGPNFNDLLLSCSPLHRR